MTATYCCVVDNHPRFMLEAIVWLNCLRDKLDEGDRCSIWFVDCQPDDVITYVEELGAHVFLNNTLIPESPHCNKILPLIAPDVPETDYLIVTDTDVYVVNSIRDYLYGHRIRFAPNNHCLPPLRVFDDIFQEAGFPVPAREGVSLFPNKKHGRRDTYINNVSAGFVLCPYERAVQFGSKWRAWAEWLINNIELLGSWRVHVDQVAIALAMEDMKEDIEFLPPQLNAVLELLEIVTRVRCFHITPGHIPKYPRYFLQDKTLDASAFNGTLASDIERLNNAIAESVAVAKTMPSIQDFIPKFHNPRWNRKTDSLR